jgi:hypothetical protein
MWISLYLTELVHGHPASTDTIDGSDVASDGKETSDLRKHVVS